MAAILPESELRKRRMWVVAFVIVAAALLLHRLTSKPAADRPSAGRFDPAAEQFAYERIQQLRGPRATLSPREETLYRVMWAVKDMDEGGFQTFFHDAAGDATRETVEAFEKIGAVETARLFEAAGALFGPSGPPRDRLERRKRLALFNWDERAQLVLLGESFHARGDDLYLLLQRYFEADRPEIRRDPLEAFLPWPGAAAKP